MNLDDGRVVSNFMVQALKNQPMTLYGDGSQTRSFCYVDDLIEGIVRFMKTDDSVTGPMNLGNPEEYSMLELAENIRSLTSSSSEFCFKPLPQDDPKKRKPDISYAKETLFWEPAVPLKEGLEKTCHYFSKKLKE
jgi:UDP-glucuronate decarboxylase